MFAPAFQRHEGGKKRTKKQGRGVVFRGDHMPGKEGAKNAVDARALGEVEGPVAH